MKTLMTTTALLVTMSTAAFANPIAIAVCADHNDPAACEQAIGYIADAASRFQDQNRAIYHAGYSDFDDLLAAAAETTEVTVEVPVEVIVEVPVEVDAAPGQLVTAFANGKAEGKAEGYEIGLAAGAAEAESFGFDAGYVAGIDASQGLVAEARADLAAVEAGVDAAIAEGIAAIDVDKIAHEARKEAINAIAVPISAHKKRAGENFRNNPVEFITFAFNYIEDLQRQLGLR